MEKLKNLKNLKSKWHIVLFFIELFITFLLIALIRGSGEDYKFSDFEEEQFENPWVYNFENGTSGTTTLPAKLDVEGDVHHLTLTNRLPQIQDNTTFVFRARHTFTKVYVDNELVYDQRDHSGQTPVWFDMEGNVFVEVPLASEDTGKTIRIESSCPVTKYITAPGMVFLGERSTFFVELIRERATTLYGSFLMLIFAIILFVAWLALTFTMKGSYQNLLCLSIFTFLMSCWQFTETRCMQFVFPNMRLFTVMGYEYLMLITAPIAMCFYYAPWERTRKLAKISTCISLGLWVFNHLMYLLGVAHMADTLLITQVVIFIQILFIGYIQCGDLLHSRKAEGSQGQNIFWRLPMMGLCIMLPLLLIEIFRYIFGNQNHDNGVLATVAIFIYILTLALQSAFKVASEFSQAKSASETKTQFLANMSHEIRTPLNAIMGFDELILRDASDEKTLSYASNIRTAGQNLQYIINTILDMSKIESGKMEIDEVGYSTAQFLDSIAVIISSQANDKGLEFKVNIDESIPAFLIGDDMHLRQVLINLLNNAVKYTNQGSVTLSAKLETFSQEENFCEIHFYVVDTGVVIRQEDREKLFAKFERLDVEKNRHVEGTGLGMSIVVSLLTAMHSKIELESEYGKGSTFHFVIRQRTIGKTKIGVYERGMSQQIGDDTSQKQRFIAPNARVLIVDDVPLNNIVTMGLLEETQMQVDAVESGKEALQAVKNNRYDVILMDHMMPGMDGIQVTSAIREVGKESGDSYYSTVPILALTANAVSGMREVFMDNGMQDYITKPVDGDQLLSALQKWLPQDKLTIKSQEEVEQEKGDAWNYDIEGVDANLAKKFFTSREEYEVGLQSFLDSFQKNRDHLVTYTEDGDFENAVIIVHGLKNSARVIGATKLSEFSKDLESRMHNKEDSAWFDVDDLLDQYRSIAKGIAACFANENSSSVVLTEEEEREALENLQKIADEFDMDELMKWEKIYQHTTALPERQIFWEDIVQAVKDVSFMEIVEKIEEYPFTNS